MDTIRGSSHDRVELIQATDSLSTVPPNAILSFAPPKMSRQPIRVAKPPQPRTQRYPQSAGNNYNEIVRMAEQQRRLIDANRQEIERRQHRPDRIENAAARLSALRNEVLREEREMACLNAIQREARETFAKRIAAEKHLYDLQNTFSSQEEQLRKAASRIDSLKAQLDLLYRRRLSAINAARVQQKRFNTQNAKTHSIRNDEPSRSKIVAEIPSSRPRASVEPFQITRPTVVLNSDFEKRQNEGAVVGAPPPPPPPPPPSLPTQSPQKILSPSKDFTDRVIFRKSLPSEQKLGREESPSPPKDPYPSPVFPVERPTILVQKPESKISSSVPMSSVKNVISADVASISSNPLSMMSPSSVITSNSAGNMAQFSRRGANMHHLWNEARILDEEAAKSYPVAVSREEDVGRIAMADQISIRADTLRATKRRSWAQQETPVDEAEYIRKILCEQQKKGRTHLNLDPHLENLLHHSTIPEVVTEKIEPNDLVKVTKETTEVLPSTSKSTEEAKIENVTTAVVESEVSIDTAIEEEIIDEKESSEAISSSESQDSQRSCELPYESLKLIKPPPEKGILRPSGMKKSRGHIVFDPLALLLDAALEGEMDLVKTSAAKISDLSASNDEGITALHNAICAGHYEIVRFLVESCADVNAQDSDGWTPLHCAASCNNLPMVKLLVENGACIFAQTLSDLETPAEKCEEDEDGYEGCQLYLHSAHTNAGSVNEGKMYAAYSYDRMRDDELSFKKGECLKVIERDGEERSWWLCERINTNNDQSSIQQGLVPRNFLALYPSLANRPKDFVTFELPVVECLTNARNEQNLDAKNDCANSNNIKNNSNDNVLKMDIVEQVLIEEQIPMLSVS